MDRHEPEQIYTQLLETGQLLVKRLQCPLVGKLAQVDLIDDRVAAPAGVFHFGRGNGRNIDLHRLLGGSCEAQQRAHATRNSFQNLFMVILMMLL